MDIRTVLVSATLLLASSFTCAQDSDQALDNTDDDETPIEEIIVTGPRTIIHMRLEVEQAMYRMYDIYNEVNTDDDFDVHCRHRTPTGTRISRKVCTPVYFSKLESEAARFAFQGMHASAMSRYTMIARNNAKLRENMKRLILSSPELFDAAVEHANMRQELKTQRRKLWGDFFGFVE